MELLFFILTIFNYSMFTFPTPVLQAYEWENDRLVVEWLVEQLDETGGTKLIQDNINCLQRDHTLLTVRR